jgi:hypothetical protein
MPYMRAQRVIGNFQTAGPWTGETFYQRAGVWSTQGPQQREGAVAVSPHMPPEGAEMLAGQPQQGTGAAGATSPESPQGQSVGRPIFRMTTNPSGTQQMTVNRPLSQMRSSL